LFNPFANVLQIQLTFLLLNTRNTCNMNIRNKLHLVFILAIVVLFGVLVFFMKTHERQNDMIVRSVADQQVVLINAAVSVTSNQLDQIVRDYTNWDDIIYYLHHPDKKWAVDNIATIINSFQLYSVGAYDLKNKLIYSFGEGSLSVMNDPIVNMEVLRILHNKGSIHYFQNTPQGLIEVSGAEIHTTLDTKRSFAPAGYFLISKLWDRNSFVDLSKNTGSTVIFLKPGSGYSDATSYDSINISKRLYAHDAENAGMLVFKKSNKLLANVHQINNFVFFFLGGTLLFILLLLFIVQYRWVRRPLKIISNSLRMGDTSQLSRIEKNKDEFSQIARLISIFYHQKKELELENIERKFAQEELLKQSRTLQGLAIASNHLLTDQNFDRAIQQALEAVCKSSQIDRIFIYKTFSDPVTNLKKAIRMHEWIVPDIFEKVSPSESKELVFAQEAESLYQLLLNGHQIKLLTIELPEVLKDIVERQLIKGMIIVPIIDPEEKRLWGFVGFSDCRKPHRWTTSEETVLGLLANSIGGAIRRQLSQEELKEAMHLARSADSAKSEFLAAMSHEIRTPMNGVLGMTSLLLHSDLSNDQREYVEIIETSGESLLTIINEILDFSKIESGLMKMEETSFDLRRCIEDVLDLMAPKALEKHLDIIYYIDPLVHQFIFGDGFRLRQIIVNLVGNAIKFTEKGDILIYVSQADIINSDVILEFSVKDTGIGIPADKLNGLFAPFIQVDSSTSRNYGGTGLGLAISSSLVKLMNGRIWVVSEVGVGSDFRFTIQTRYISIEEEINPVYKILQSLPGKRVLIVDDNSSNRRILQWQCEYWGMKATATESGTKALEILDKDSSFDVAILDMQMPRMDGIMLAHEIRKKYSKSELPLVMLTSFGFNTHKDEIRELFSFYVSKPVKHSQLAEILYKVLAAPKEILPDTRDMAANISEISQSYPFKILVAEDNVINQKLIRNLFELLGYRPSVVANGIEVISALKGKQFDLIFMDVQMPEMDGLEATTIIVERMKENRPIIIAMTANAMQSDKNKCIAAGMDDYLTKPIRVEDLQKVIQFWGEKQIVHK
jgi:signal transduction histidine kinase/DNA-binding response OmpR family regulator